MRTLFLNDGWLDWASSKDFLAFSKLAALEAMELEPVATKSINHWFCWGDVIANSGAKEAQGMLVSPLTNNTLLSAVKYCMFYSETKQDSLALAIEEGLKKESWKQDFLASDKKNCSLESPSMCNVLRWMLNQLLSNERSLREAKAMRHSFNILWI